MICPECERSMKRIMNRMYGPEKIEIFNCKKCSRNIQVSIKDGRRTIKEI